MSETIRINENTWRIEDNGVRFFVLAGEKEALVIDTGMNTPDAKAIAEKLTSLPLRLINTHADPDHISGNEAFGEFMMDEAERENYFVIHRKTGNLVPVRDGDRIDLGGRILLVIGNPGHTPGSIALLDVGARVLYGGDAIQDGRIFMFGERRDLKKYVESLENLLAVHGGEFDTVYPSHGSIPVAPELITKLIAAAKDILAGKSAGKTVDFRGKSIRVHDFGFATFLCDDIDY